MSFDSLNGTIFIMPVSSGRRSPAFFFFFGSFPAATNGSALEALAVLTGDSSSVFLARASIAMDARSLSSMDLRLVSRLEPEEVEN